MIYIVRGLSYGDEGKGSIVDYLSRNCTDVIKEGGPQAAHHIVSRNGMMHRSEQMGSGVFNEGVRTFSSKNALICPQNLIMENTMLHMAGIHDGMKRMFIDSRCPVVTPFHKMIGQMKEVITRRGSTGMGVGEAVKDWKENKDVLTIGDFVNEEVLKEKLEVLYSEKFIEAKTIVGSSDKLDVEDFYQSYKNSISVDMLFNSYRNFAITYPNCIINDGDKCLCEMLESERDIIFEGSQGALLDPVYGFPPYITKTRTVFDTALELMRNKVPESDIRKIGVIRAYSTRHGAGPFVTEDKELTELIPDEYNTANVWQGKFRIGWFDLLAVKYGIMVNKGVDSIAITNLDRLSEVNHISLCIGYKYYIQEHSCRTYDALDEYFIWEPGRKLDEVNIIGFKNRKYSTYNDITRILLGCEPVYREFDGWKTDISNVKRMEDLSKEVINYIKFLEEELNVPISIISVGETSEDKIVFEDNQRG